MRNQNLEKSTLSSWECLSQKRLQGYSLQALSEGLAKESRRPATMTGLVSGKVRVLELAVLAAWPVTCSLRPLWACSPCCKSSNVPTLSSLTAVIGKAMPLGPPPALSAALTTSRTPWPRLGLWLAGGRREDTYSVRAPFATRALRHSRLPERAALWMGVSPSQSGLLMLAPAWISQTRHWGCPPNAAMCAGVWA